MESHDDRDDNNQIVFVLCLGSVCYSLKNKTRFSQ